MDWNWLNIGRTGFMLTDAVRKGNRGQQSGSVVWLLEFSHILLCLWGKNSYQDQAIIFNTRRKELRSSHVKCMPGAVHVFCFSQTNLIRQACQPMLLLLFASSVQLCLTLCDPMDCSTPGFSVLHCLRELAQIHVHWVGDAMQPSHPLSFPSPPAFNLSQHQGLFQWVGSLMTRSNLRLREFKSLDQSNYPNYEVTILLFKHKSVWFQYPGSFIYTISSLYEVRIWWDISEDLGESSQQRSIFERFKLPP